MNTPTAYDRIRYRGWPYHKSHPERLATLGRLFGMSPADPARCRVLELGCGDGGNLVPLAYAWPDARFLGIDLAEAAIEDGRRNAQALDLANVELRVGNLESLPEDLGEFDYVIAHGVYSWVPEKTRRALLAACRRYLAPQGIAYVSYNILPGGHLRRMLREMLLMHGEGIEEPERLCAAAHEFLELVSLSNAAGPGDPPRAALAKEAEMLAKRPDAGLFHDDLSPEFHLCYFRDFCEEAQSQGLQFLAESDFFEMGDGGFPPAAREKLAAIAPDLVEREQYLDFLKVRRFRQTLLCRSNLPLESELRGESLQGLRVSAIAQPENDKADALSEAEQRYRGRAGSTFATSKPAIKVALQRLMREWPRALTFAELMDACSDGIRSPEAQDESLLIDFVLKNYATGFVDLHAGQAAFARWPGPRPRASALARMQAKQSSSVTNLLGRLVSLDNALSKTLLELLDGTRDRDALLREIRGDEAEMKTLLKSVDGRTDEAALAEALERSLEALGLCGLLHAD